MSIEAMKQALEALDRCGSENYSLEREAITSLRQAIEQYEKQVCVGCEGNPQGENIPCVVCGATPQPQQAEKQKPVFWYRPRSDGMYEGPLHNKQIEQVRRESGGWVPLYTTPQPQEFVCSTGLCHYTQPQREWVGLTDEQRRAEFAKLYPADDALLNLAENNRDFMVEAIGARHHWHAFQLGSKSTEAKLKEKNT